MTEFEAASLALQEIANNRTLGVGVGQIAVIIVGLIVMQAEGRARAREHADRHAESMAEIKAQHAETMAVLDAQRRALEALIARTDKG